MRCLIWYHLCNLKNMKNTHGGVLILVKLQASARYQYINLVTIQYKNCLSIFKRNFFWYDFCNFVSFKFYVKISPAEVSLRNSAFDLDEDFDSKEDLLLYFVAIQQKINRFQKTVFHKKSLTRINLAFRIENLGKLTFWTKITGVWDSKYK